MKKKHAVGEFQKRQHLQGACHRNRELVLKMGMAGNTLNEIARKIGTTGRHVRKFLDQAGVKREYPNAYRGEKSSRWKGGRTVDKNGYVRILSPEHPHKSRTGYVLEHRLVMEKMLGRYLLPNEVVHHKDGNKSHNSPENLQLFSENKEHLRHELKGRVPKWTEHGKARIRQGVEKEASRRRGRNDWHWRMKLKRDGLPLPQTALHYQWKSRKVAPRPSQMERLLYTGQKASEPSEQSDSRKAIELEPNPQWTDQKS